MVIKVGSNEYEAVFNGFTPIAFSRCFSVTKENGATRPKDIAEAVGMIVESMQSVGVPSITALLEIFYACIKTANPKFDVPFGKWLDGFPADAFDLQNGDGWATDVMRIVEDNFFPTTPDGVEAAPAKKTRAAASE